MEKAKNDWIEGKRQDIEEKLQNNSSKKAYELVKDLTSLKKGHTTTIQSKDGNELTEDQDIVNRWTKYCSQLFNRGATRKPEVLNVAPVNNI
ncbi:endonuclease-reverse transcriptase [Plakobranchus ocellatus]|uniref:Endonuclease-reverse transcriptase n=1 Tax=Plakobranchus ocellatus TaxID=259542 RepID=A0AAV4CC09_9GAST|nr:endonuclease-reverse transcriptase [Plakobranchus ocellatus]